MGEQPMVLPCPWCGEGPEISPWHGGGPRKHMVSCTNELCGSSPSVTGTTRRKAVANWNAREHAPSETVAARKDERDRIMAQLRSELRHLYGADSLTFAEFGAVLDRIARGEP